jgi:hypothetical protein
MLPVVHTVYNDHIQILEYLRAQGELSFANSVESALPKVLLLASASHLEHELQALVLDYFREVTNHRDCAVLFVKNKAVSRQYHTYFDWDRGNASKFFALFGENFKAAMGALLKDDSELAQAIKDFVNLGSLRNQLVHQNYASFTMESTADEIWKMYESALKFIARLPSLLRNHG